MSHFMAGYAKVIRTGLILSGAAMLLALSSAGSVADSESSTGFSYSDYLQSSGDFGSSTITGVESFSIESGGGIWRDASSKARHSVNELSFSEYLAEEYINGGESAIFRAGNELTQAGWNIGEEMIEQGAFSLLEDFRIDGGIRRFDVNIESKFGRGFSNIGVGAVMALREHESEAYAMEFRGYAGEESRTGLNIGLLYRREVEQALMGGNVFFDYEDHEGHGFARWSLGGEVRSAWLDIFGNIYRVGTDDKMELGTGYVTYSSDGFGFEAHIHSPDNTMLAGILGYYHWEGNYTEHDESGKYVGLRVTPPKVPILFELNLGDGDGRHLGGRVAFKHTFGRNDGLEGYSRSPGFSAKDYMFAPAEREHTQRISRVKANSGYLDGVARATDLNGIANVRAVGRVFGEDRDAETNVRLDILDGDLRVAGQFEGVLTTYMDTFPWGFPPSQSVTVRMGAEVGTEMPIEWNRGAASALLEANTQVAVGENDMRLLNESRVSVDMGGGFRYESGDIEVFTGEGQQVDMIFERTTSGGSIELNGEFTVEGLRYEGINVILTNGGYAGVSLSWGADLNLDRMTFSEGIIIVTDINGASLGELGCQDGICPIDAMFDLGDLEFRIESPFEGTGTLGNPFVMPHQHTGLVATVRVLGPLVVEYLPISGTEFSITPRGVIEARSPGLSRGMNVITVVASVSSETGGRSSTLMIHTFVPAMLSITIAGRGITGDGSPGSPILAGMGTVALATLTTVGGFGSPTVYEWDSTSTFTFADGVVSWNNTVPAGLHVLTLSVTRGVETALATVHVSVVTGILANPAPATGQTGDGTQSSPLIANSLNRTPPLATVVAVGGAGSGSYTFTGASSGVSVDASGVIFPGQAADGTYTLAITVSRSTDSTILTVYVRVEPLIAGTVMPATGQTGDGTQSSPLVVDRLNRTPVLATVNAVGGGGSGAYTFTGQATSGVSVDANGGIFAGASTTPDVTQALVITVSRGGDSTMLTVYVRVETSPVGIRAEAVTIGGDGTSGLPFQVDIANADVMRLVGSGGDGTYTYSLGGGGGVFTHSSGMIRAGALVSSPREVTLTVVGISAGTTVALTLHVCHAPASNWNSNSDVQFGDGQSNTTPYRVGPEHAGMRITVSSTGGGCGGAGGSAIYSKLGEITHEGTNSNLYDVSSDGVITFRSGQEPLEGSTRISDVNVINQIQVMVRRGSYADIETVYVRPRTHCPVIFSEPTGRTFSNTVGSIPFSSDLTQEIETIIESLWVGATDAEGFTPNRHWSVYLTEAAHIDGNNRFGRAGANQGGFKTNPLQTSFLNNNGLTRSYPRWLNGNNQQTIEKNRPIGLAPSSAVNQSGDRGPKSAFGIHVYHVYAESINLQTLRTSIGESNPAMLPAIGGNSLREEWHLAINQGNVCRILTSTEFYIDSDGERTYDDYEAQSPNDLTNGSLPN